MSETIHKMIAYFGNQDKTAKALGVTQGAVSQWVQGQTKISAEVAMKAEHLTKGQVKALELRPTLKRIYE